MAKSLDVDALLKQFPTSFESRPFYSAQDDSIQWCFENADHYARRVDNWLTVYKAFSDHRMVGFKLKNIRVLLSAYTRLGLKVTVSEEKWSIGLNLYQMFAYAPWLMTNVEQLPTYGEILPRIPSTEIVQMATA